METNNIRKPVGNFMESYLFGKALPNKNMFLLDVFFFYIENQLYLTKNYLQGVKHLIDYDF